MLFFEHVLIEISLSIFQNNYYKNKSLKALKWHQEKKDRIFNSQNGRQICDKEGGLTSTVGKA